MVLAALARARRVLRRIDLVHIDDELLDDAATLDADVLRGLDAIHLAAPRVAGADGPVAGVGIHPHAAGTRDEHLAGAGFAKDDA